LRANRVARLQGFLGALLFYLDRVSKAAIEDNHKGFIENLDDFTSSSGDDTEVYRLAK
jgi:hypothetical protein